MCTSHELNDYCFVSLSFMADDKSSLSTLSFPSLSLTTVVALSPTGSSVELATPSATPTPPLPEVLVGVVSEFSLLAGSLCLTTAVLGDGLTALLCLELCFAVPTFFFAGLEAFALLSVGHKSF